MKNLILLFSLAATVSAPFSAFAGKCDALTGGNDSSGGLGKRVNSFTERVLSQIVEHDGDAKANENLFITGPALSTAMAMLTNGASQKGLTELLGVLGYGPGELSTLNTDQAALARRMNQAGPGVVVKSANAFFIDKNLSVIPAYKQKVERDFFANVTNLDFHGRPDQTAESINLWAKTRTAGMVSEIITPDAASALDGLLASAIHFKGTWETTFDKNETHPGRFETETGESYYTPMMKTTVPLLEVVHAADHAYTVTKLPYAGGKASMYIVFPTRNWSNPSATMKADKALIAAMRAGDLERFKTGDVQRLTDEEVTLPKFALKYKHDQLKTILESLGVKAVFNGGSLLNLSQDPRLKVDYVQLDTALEVDEEGSKAAGVASIGIALESMSMSNFEFNRPFGVIIRDEVSGVDMFTGVIRKPVSK